MHGHGARDGWVLFEQLGPAADQQISQQEKIEPTRNLNTFAPATALTVTRGPRTALVSCCWVKFAEILPSQAEGLTFACFALIAVPVIVVGPPVVRYGRRCLLDLGRPRLLPNDFLFWLCHAVRVLRLVGRGCG